MSCNGIWTASAGDQDPVSIPIGFSNELQLDGDEDLRVGPDARFNPYRVFQ